MRLKPSTSSTMSLTSRGDSTTCWASSSVSSMLVLPYRFYIIPSSRIYPMRTNPIWWKEVLCNTLSLFLISIDWSPIPRIRWTIILFLTLFPLLPNSTSHRLLGSIWIWATSIRLSWLALVCKWNPSRTFARISKIYKWEMLFHYSRRPSSSSQNLSKDATRYLLIYLERSPLENAWPSNNPSQ